jgi:hypothetical protein
MKARVDGGIEEQEAVLLMDNCPSHITGDVMDLFMAAGIRLVIFAPHATQIFPQFSIFKLEGKYRLPLDEFTTTTNFVCHMDVKLAKTLTSPNICAALKRDWGGG